MVLLHNGPISRPERDDPPESAQVPQLQPVCHRAGQKEAVQVRRLRAEHGALARKTQHHLGPNTVTSHIQQFSTLTLNTKVNIGQRLSFSATKVATEPGKKSIQKTYIS